MINDKRNKGLTYKTLSGKIIPSRRVTPLSLRRKKCSEKISADTQKTLFDELWALGDYNKRSAYLSSFIFDILKKSQRIRNTLGEPKLRSINHIYNLKVDGTMIEICKGCFLKTFGISNKCVEVAIKKKSVRVTGISSPDKRGLHVPSNKIGQGSPNGGPRSASGPPTHFVRTARTQQLALLSTKFNKNVSPALSLLTSIRQISTNHCNIVN